MRLARAWRQSWRGAGVSWSGAPGWRRRRQCCRWARIADRRAGRQWPIGRLLGGVGQLHRPGTLLAGIDLEKSGAVVAARQAVLGAANGEFFFAGTHVVFA